MGTSQAAWNSGYTAHNNAQNAALAAKQVGCIHPEMLKEFFARPLKVASYGHCIHVNVSGYLIECRALKEEQGHAPLGRGAAHLHLFEQPYSKVSHPDSLIRTRLAALAMQVVVFSPILK